jgi:hypothetical protein
MSLKPVINQYIKGFIAIVHIAGEFFYGFFLKLICTDVFFLHSH